MIVWKILKIAGAAVLGLMVLYVALVIWIGSSRRLVNGYYLHNLGSAQNITLGESDEVIEPNVTLVGENDPYIFGFREHTYIYMDSFVRREGYFIIDTRNGSVHTSLTRDEFVQELQRIGIAPTSPELLLRPACVCLPEAIRSATMPRW